MIRFAFEIIPCLETSMRVGRPQPGEEKTNGGQGASGGGKGWVCKEFMRQSPQNQGDGWLQLGGHKSRSVGTLLVYAYWFNIILNGPYFSFPKWRCLNDKLCGYLTYEA